MPQADKTTAITIGTVLSVTMLAICVTKTVIDYSASKNRQKLNAPPTYVKPSDGEEPSAPPFYDATPPDDTPNTDNKNLSYIAPTIIFNYQCRIEGDDPCDSCIVIDTDCPNGNLSFFLNPDTQLMASPKYIRFNNSGPHKLIQQNKDLIFADIQGCKHIVFGLD